MDGFKVTPIVLAIPVFMLLIAIEFVASRRMKKSIYPLQDTLTSLNIGILSQFVNPLGAVISVVMYDTVQKNYGTFEWDTRQWWTWATAVVLYDFFYYWVHRTGHEVNLFWAAHVTHHSSEEFNLSTALRQSSTGFYFKWVFYLPLAVLGYPVHVFIVVGLIDLLYQYWVHTQLIGRLGWLEYVLITPSNHRVHHGQNAYCLDKNYGGIFCLWDRLFGTYADERPNEPIVYGIRTPLASWNPVWANLHHYVAIWKKMKTLTGWRNRLMCWFARPSWQPDQDSQPSDRDLRVEKLRSAAPLVWRWIGVAFTVLAVLAVILFLGGRAQVSVATQLVILGVAAGVFAAVGALWTRAAWLRFE